MPNMMCIDVNLTGLYYFDLSYDELLSAQASRRAGQREVPRNSLEAVDNGIFWPDTETSATIQAMLQASMELKV
jgi:hypothetical protein